MRVYQTPNVSRLELQPLRSKLQNGTPIPTCDSGVNCVEEILGLNCSDGVGNPDFFDARYFIPSGVVGDSCTVSVGGNVISCVFSEDWTLDTCGGEAGVVVVCANDQIECTGLEVTVDCGGGAAICTPQPQ